MDSEPLPLPLPVGASSSSKQSRKRKETGNGGEGMEKKIKESSSSSSSSSSSPTTTTTSSAKPSSQDASSTAIAETKKKQKKRVKATTPQPDVIPPPGLEDDIEEAILSLAQKRGLTKTFCPSEIVRLVLELPNWRDYMNLTRKVAYRLANEGYVDILSSMEIVSPKTEVAGPIRVRLSPTAFIQNLVKNKQ